MKSKLKWYFETTKNTFSGANDPIHETFRANPYYSIVRESIQNSMDVQLDKSKPVVVKFEILTLNQIEHPELFKIKEHIDSCLTFHKGNKQAEDLYGNMLKYLQENSAIKVLKISDYNTIGMDYKSGDHLCPFISFMSEGISSKSAGSGGSFGFGKGAYYVPSEIRTILVSTKTEDEKFFFQGRTRLASHRSNGEIKGKDGVFKINEDEPVSDMLDISPIFHRNKQGTDVFIIGMKNDDDIGDKMIKSVLNNFWLAVHENKLDVSIKTEDIDVTIDEGNLEEIINNHFSEETETDQIGDIYKWNPKAYYKAVKYANNSNDFLYFEENLNVLGKVRFYVYRKNGLMNRISLMRKPAMTVFKITRNLLSGYAAVFICDNDGGNEILRQMENAAHNEWKAENVRYVSSSDMRIYIEARKEFISFIQDKLKSISGIDSSSKMEIAELANYLSIPEELLEENEIITGSANATRYGNSSRNETINETASITTNLHSIKIKPKIQSGDLHAVGINSSIEIGDDFSSTSGENNTGSGGDEPAEGFGGKIDGGSNDPNGDSITQIPIQLRVAATKEGSNIFHNLMITSEMPYKNVRILIFAGTDNNIDLPLKITFSDKGSVTKNRLDNVELNKGKNIFKIRFEDEIKYTLKLAAYEVK